MTIDHAVRRRILVVDDDADCCAALRSLLGGEGFDVEVATSGARALACVAERAPDVVLSDIRMPGMDGWALLSTLLAAGDPGFPVILMSADGKGEAAVLDAGAAAYVTKPLDIDALVRAIDRALGSGVRH